MSETTEPTLPLATRLWFAWVCFFRVLFDGAFAGRAFEVRDRMPALPPPPEPKRADKRADKKLQKKAEPAPEKRPEEPKPEPQKPAAPDAGPALQLLALLQREGRLVDFLEQDIASFADAEIGAAARVVHEGCRKALRGHAKLAPVRGEEEGARVTLEAGFDPAEIKLIGNVGGSAPYKGVIRHRGWRAADLTLPTPVAGHDPRVIAPAEVEL